MVKEIDLNSALLNERAMEWNVLGDQKLAVEIVQALCDTVDEEKDRLYLCTNEIGYKERAFVIKFSDEHKVYMNPIFQKRDKLRLVREYDPLTKKQYIIPRYTEVTLCYQNSVGKIEAVKFNEEASAIVSQAMDCLEGIHSADYGLEVDEDFDKATPEEREELLSAYLNSLNTLKSNIEDDLNSDEETKKEYDAFRFMKAKANGEIDSGDEPKLNRKQRRFFERLAKKLRRRKK